MLALKHIRTSIIHKNIHKNTSFISTFKYTPTTPKKIEKLLWFALTWTKSSRYMDTSAEKVAIARNVNCPKWPPSQKQMTNGGWQWVLLLPGELWGQMERSASETRSLIFSLKPFGSVRLLSCPAVATPSQLVTLSSQARNGWMERGRNEWWSSKRRWEKRKRSWVVG